MISSENPSNFEVQNIKQESVFHENGSLNEELLHNKFGIGIEEAVQLVSFGNHNGTVAQMLDDEKCPVGNMLAESYQEKGLEGVIEKFKFLEAMDKNFRVEVTKTSLRREESKKKDKNNFQEPSNITEPRKPNTPSDRIRANSLPRAKRDIVRSIDIPDINHQEHVEILKTSQVSTTKEKPLPLERSLSPKFTQETVVTSKESSRVFKIDHNQKKESLFVLDPDSVHQAQPDRRSNRSADIKKKDKNITNPKTSDFPYQSNRAPDLSLREYSTGNSWQGFIEEELDIDEEYNTGDFLFEEAPLISEDVPDIDGMNEGSEGFVDFNDAFFSIEDSFELLEVEFLGALLKDIQLDFSEVQDADDFDDSFFESIEFDDELEYLDHIETSLADTLEEEIQLYLDSLDSIQVQDVSINAESLSLSLIERLNIDLEPTISNRLIEDSLVLDSLYSKISQYIEMSIDEKNNIGTNEYKLPKIVVLISDLASFIRQKLKSNILLGKYAIFAFQNAS